MGLLKFTKSDLFSVLSIVLFILGLAAVVTWISSPQASSPSTSTSSNGINFNNNTNFTREQSLDMVPRPENVTEDTKNTSFTIKESHGMASRVNHVSKVTEAVVEENLMEEEERTWNLHQDFNAVSGLLLSEHSFMELYMDYCSFLKFETALSLPVLPATGKSLNDFYDLRINAESTTDYFKITGELTGNEERYEVYVHYKEWSANSQREHEKEQARALIRREETSSLIEQVRTLRPNYDKSGSQCFSSEETVKFNVYLQQLEHAEGSGAYGDPEFFLGEAKEIVKVMKATKGPADCY